MSVPLPVTDLKTVILMWALILCGLAPALYLHIIHYINYDIAWLVTAAERLLRGGTMLHDAYETNPPLSLIIMMPPVLMNGVTGLPLYYATTLYSTLLIAFGTAAVFALLQRLGRLPVRDVHLITAAYLAGMLILPTVDYGERDHLVMAGLFPFLLLQLNYTHRRSVSRAWQIPVLLLGTVLVLVKPHFGLLPTLMLLHRAVVQRRLFGLLRDADFIALAVGTLSYIALVFAVFPDYAHHIFPDVLELYVSMRDPLVINMTVGLVMLFLVALVVFTVLVPRTTDGHNMTVLLLCAALAALIPYFVQGKGYWYHLVPALTFAGCGVTLGLRLLLAQYMPFFPRLQYLLVAAAMLAGLLMTMPLNFTYPTHNDMRRFEMVAHVTDCPAPCSYYMLNNNLGVIYPLSIYSGKPHASRFPSVWFVPPILAQHESGAPTAAAYHEKYARMMGEDFVRFKPDILLIGNFPVKKNSDEIFDFAAFFATDPAFAAQWAQYRRADSITIDQARYYRGTALDKPLAQKFDIYHRIGGGAEGLVVPPQNK